MHTDSQEAFLLGFNACTQMERRVIILAQKSILYLLLRSKGLPSPLPQLSYHPQQKPTHRRCKYVQKEVTKGTVLKLPHHLLSPKSWLLSPPKLDRPKTMSKDSKNKKIPCPFY
jgi:hypothetical protein